jgi:hypothetical protein
MGNRRWTTSKLEPWRSSPSSWLYPRSCSCSRPQRWPHTSKVTMAVRTESHPSRGRVPRKATAATTPPAKRTNLRADPIADRVRRGGTGRRAARPNEIRNATQTVVEAPPRAPRRWEPDKVVMVYMGRIRDTVLTPIARTTRTTTHAMAPRPRTEPVAGPAELARDAWATPTTGSRPVKDRTLLITTRVTNVIRTAASARPTLLTQDAGCHHPRAANRRVASHRHHRCEPTRSFRSHRYFRFHRMSCFRSLRSVLRLRVSSTRSARRSKPDSFCPAPGAAWFHSVSRVWVWCWGVSSCCRARVSSDAAQVASNVGWGWREPPPSVRST